VKYWDTSALVPLIFVEPQSRAVRHLIFADDAERRLPVGRSADVPVGLPRAEPAMPAG